MYATARDLSAALTVEQITELAQHSARQLLDAEARLSGAITKACCSRRQRFQRS